MYTDVANRQAALRRQNIVVSLPKINGNQSISTELAASLDSRRSDGSNSINFCIGWMGTPAVEAALPPASLWPCLVPHWTENDLIANALLCAVGVEGVFHLLADSQRFALINGIASLVMKAIALRFKKTGAGRSCILHRGAVLDICRGGSSS